MWFIFTLVHVWHDRHMLLCVSMLFVTQSTDDKYGCRFWQKSIPVEVINGMYAGLGARDIGNCWDWVKRVEGTI